MFFVFLRSPRIVLYRKRIEIKFIVNIVNNFPYKYFFFLVCSQEEFVSLYFFFQPFCPSLIDFLVCINQFDLNTVYPHVFVDLSRYERSVGFTFCMSVFFLFRSDGYSNIARFSLRMNETEPTNHKKQLASWRQLDSL